MAHVCLHVCVCLSRGGWVVVVENEKGVWTCNCAVFTQHITVNCLCLVTVIVCCPLFTVKKCSGMRSCAREVFIIIIIIHNASYRRISSSCNALSTLTQHMMMNMMM